MSELKKNNVPEKVSFIIIGFIIILLCVYGALNYSAKLGNDEHNHVTFARNLSNGKFFYDIPVISIFDKLYSSNKNVYVYYGGERIRDGKIFSKIEIGGPLLLALAAKLFGEDSMFFVTPFTLVLLSLFVFLSARELFYREKYRNSIGIIATMLILLLNTEIVRYSRTPLRDIPSMAFMFASIFLLLRSMRNVMKINLPFFAASIFLIGFSCTTRITNVLILLPYAIYIFFASLRRGGYKSLITAISVSAIAFGIGIAPIAIQNYATSGNLFVPPQSPEAVGLITFLPAEREGLGLDPSNLTYKVALAPKWFFSVYNPFLSVFIIIGLIFSWKKLEIKTLYLISPIIFFFLFCMWGKKVKPKYFLFIHPFVVTLISYGIIRTLSINLEKKWKIGRLLFNADARIILIIIAVFIITVFSLARDIQGEKAEGIFGISEAHFFKQEIEKLVPKNSVVFAARYLSPNIDFYTHAYSLSPRQLSAPWNLPENKAINILLDHGYKLYIFNNLAVQNAAGWIESLKDNFTPTHIAEIKSEDLNIHRENVSAREYLKLYKIERWHKKEVVLNLDTEEKTDYILTCNLRNVWSEDRPERKISVILNGEIIGDSLKNGVNFFLLPKENVTVPSSEFKIVADISLPQDIFVSIQPLIQDYFIDIGSEKRNKDALYVSKEMIDNNSEVFNYRNIGGKGSISIPTIIPNDSQIDIKLSCAVENPPSMKFENHQVLLFVNNQQCGQFLITEPNIYKTYGNAIYNFEAIAGYHSVLEFNVVKNLHINPLRSSVKLDWLKIEHWARELNYNLPVSNKVNEPTVLIVEVKGMPDETTTNSKPGLIYATENFENSLKNGFNIIIIPDNTSDSNIKTRLISTKPLSGNALVHFVTSYISGPSHKIDIGGEDEVFIIDGLHQREKSGGSRNVRWTTGTARLRIPCINVQNSYFLELVFIPPPPSVKNRELRLSINGKETGSYKIDVEDLQTVSIEIPDGILIEGFNDILINVPSWKPSEHYGTKDFRELGIMLDSITISHKSITAKND